VFIITEFIVTEFDCILPLCFNTYFSDREKDRQDLQNQIDNLAKQSAQERDEIRKELEDERKERSDEAKAMQELFR